MQGGLSRGGETQSAGGGGGGPRRDVLLEELEDDANVDRSLDFDLGGLEIALGKSCKGQGGGEEAERK